MGRPIEVRAVAGAFETAFKHFFPTVDIVVIAEVVAFVEFKSKIALNFVGVDYKLEQGHQLFFQLLQNM